MRSDVEWQLNLIAQGKADYDDVCEFSLDIFKRKFEYFRKNMSKMEELFSSKFETVADVGKKMSRCGQCHRYTKLIEGRPPKLLCEKCDKFYSLPLKGAVRPYEDSACPLDGFGLIQCSIEGRGKVRPSTDSSCQLLIFTNPFLHSSLSTPLSSLLPLHRSHFTLPSSILTDAVLHFVSKMLQRSTIRGCPQTHGV
jgi:hypothetical protein